MSNNNPATGKIPFVGVVRPSMFRNIGNVKRLMLMFDEIAIDLSYHLHQFENTVLTNARAEIDYLANQGLLTTLSGLQARHGGVERRTVTGSEWIGDDLAGDLHAYMRTTMRIQESSILNEINEVNGRLRYTASGLRLKGVDAVAVPTENESFNIDSKAERETVIKLTLFDFPTPAVQTPWESIIDFKKSKAPAEKLIRLKKWIADITTRDLSILNVADELQHLLKSYEYEFEHREMVARKNKIEIFVITTAEVLEHVAKFKLSDAAKAIFDIGKQEMILLEEERKLTGKELAYIYSANSKFKISQ